MTTNKPQLENIATLEPIIYKTTCLFVNAGPSIEYNILENFEFKTQYGQNLNAVKPQYAADLTYSYAVEMVAKWNKKRPKNWRYELVTPPPQKQKPKAKELPKLKEILTAEHLGPLLTAFEYVEKVRAYGVNKGDSPRLPAELTADLYYSGHYIKELLDNHGTEKQQQQLASIIERFEPCFNLKRA